MIKDDDVRNSDQINGQNMVKNYCQSSESLGLWQILYSHQLYNPSENRTEPFILYEIRDPFFSQRLWSWQLWSDYSLTSMLDNSFSRRVIVNAIWSSDLTFINVIFMTNILPVLSYPSSKNLSHWPFAATWQIVIISGIYPRRSGPSVPIETTCAYSN